MPARSDEAIVLRLSDFSETSQVATLFCAESGQVRVLAKGARRGTRARPAVGLDLLERGVVGFIPPRAGEGLGTLTDWSQVEAYAGLRRSAVRIHAGLYAAEMLTVLTEEYDPAPALFAALATLLGVLSAANEDAAGGGAARAELAAVVRFQSTLLKTAGFAPNLHACVVCGAARQAGAAAWFSSTGGGLVCRGCAAGHGEKRGIAAELVDAPSISGQTQAWFDLLDYHATHLAGRPLASAAALRRAAMRGVRPA